MHLKIQTKVKLLIITALLLGALYLYSSINTPEINTGQTALFIQHKKQSAADFYKKQCGFCHTSEELIAPDMNKIKAVYKEKYKTKEAFIQAITKFVKNPDKKTAIYKEGIEDFMDMPKMPFKEEQIKAVAAYIYDNADL